MQRNFSKSYPTHTHTLTHAWVCFKAYDVFVCSPGFCFFFSLFLIFFFFFYFILLLFDLSLISGKDYFNSQLSLENFQHVAVLVWVFSESRAQDEDLGAVSRKQKWWRKCGEGDGAGWRECRGEESVEVHCWAGRHCGLVGTLWGNELNISRSPTERWGGWALSHSLVAVAPGSLIHRHFQSARVNWPRTPAHGELTIVPWNQVGRGLSICSSHLSQEVYI